MLRSKCLRARLLLVAKSPPSLASPTPQTHPAPAVQDGLFVREFTRFLAACLAAAPPAHFDLLLGGAAALRDELRWFQVGSYAMHAWGKHGTEQ